MGRFGVYLMIAAVVSGVLTYTNYRLTLLAWMDDLGAGAWVLRAVMFFAGGAMLLADSRNAPATPR